MDPRRERTRAALRLAILRLAAERDIIDVSVSDVTRAAEINRATFYKHADSPQALLADALRAELLASKATFEAASHRPGRTPHELLRATLGWLADHVESHASIYRAGLARASGQPLAPLLSEHFEETLIGYLREHPSILPSSAATAAEATTEQRAAGYAVFVAAGTVGVIAAWLTLPEPRSRTLFTEVILNSLAAWWTGDATAPSADDPAASSQPTSAHHTVPLI